MTPNKSTRVLRNIAVKEISGVDSGAGRGVRITMLKREQEADMSIDIAKAAQMVGANTFDELVKMQVAKGLSRSTAIDRALRTTIGQQAFALAKKVSGADLLKLGGGGTWPANSEHSGANQRNLAGSGNQAEDDELGRLRRQHALKAYKDFNSIVDAHVAAGRSRSDAISLASREHSDLFQAAKNASAKDTLDSDTGRSPLMVPRAHAGEPLGSDMNAYRPPAGTQRYG